MLSNLSNYSKAELSLAKEQLSIATESVKCLHDLGYFDGDNDAAYQRISAQISYESTLLKTEMQMREKADEKPVSEPETKSNSDTNTKSDISSGYADIYVDGSYNENTNTYGYGVLIQNKTGEKKRVISGNGIARHGGRNVEGEVAGAKRALEFAMAHGYTDVTIYHDYEGIGKWADQLWKRNKPYTKDYADFVASCRNNMSIRFVHVDGHTGVEGNELVDTVAKEACGMATTKKAMDALDRVRSESSNIRCVDDEMVF